MPPLINTSKLFDDIEAGRFTTSTKLGTNRRDKIELDLARKSTEIDTKVETELSQK
jgi:hypothetical protein